ncbi:MULTISPECIES: hypothetical protein [unclassified Undibacterium]|uniref:hypothetical protein n=1 Tax=unclassified Undibacterium TaxID=2630295 RepID=UPI002AC8E158|nr:MULTISPECIES: hypothetical protein [unclassified Undibacterium]MEB0140695.1 hypothetical protein [Undibacterium sp. CCC2.1]MEB0172313.1 hypothetical protein [Undibacterium sp. CCC1.1]MEB0176228.1 hypothetical protein [Undibacterium sp. CCC3.4]MEB0215532.1 hypothetical protein [Undibacterium sp. 5I2]WPX44321.1 hypothetical protein RHM61_03570 [Undibacterium sp. CCC3.4]
MGEHASQIILPPYKRKNPCSSGSNIIGGASAQSTSSFLQGTGASGAIYYPIPVFPVIGAVGGINNGYGGQRSIEGGLSFPSGASVTPIVYGFQVNKKKEK